MKRLLITIISVLIFGTPAISSAQTCGSTISFPVFFSDAQKISAIRNALADYTSYAAGENYELCFSMNELEIRQTDLGDVLNPNTPFTINTNSGEPKGVYIVGLKLKSDLSSGDPVTSNFIVANNNGTGNLILKDINLKDVKNGIKLTGNAGNQIVDSLIEGDSTKSGAGVDIESNGAVVKSSEISSCGEGIAVGEASILPANDVLIGAENHATMSANKNNIYNNVIGIHVVNGSRNLFGYNLIYDNKPLMASEGAAKDAITVESGANEDLIPLAVEMDEGEEHALRCDRNEAGDIVKRWLKFEAPQTDGIVTLYRAGMDRQPDMYLTSCILGDGGECVIEELPPAVLSLIPEGECGIDDYYVNAIFNGTSSTELMSQSIIFDGVVAFVSTPYDIPASNPVEGSNDDDDAEAPGVGMQDGATTSGAGGGTNPIAAAAGGCSKGGASLANNSFSHIVFSFNAWWVLLALAIAGGFRFAAAKVRTNGRNK